MERKSGHGKPIRKFYSVSCILRNVYAVIPLSFDLWGDNFAVESLLESQWVTESLAQPEPKQLFLLRMDVLYVYIYIYISVCLRALATSTDHQGFGNQKTKKESAEDVAHEYKCGCSRPGILFCKRASAAWSMYHTWILCLQNKARSKTGGFRRWGCR